MLGDELAVFVVVETGDAVAVGGANEIAVRVVLVSGFLNLVVIAGKGVDQPSQYIAFELGNPQRGLAVEVVWKRGGVFFGDGLSAQLRHQFGGEGGVVAEFALLDQFVAGIVAVAGQLMVETAFGNQAVEDVVGKAVARTVFIGEAD